LGRNKLILNPEQVEVVVELQSKGLSSYEIAKKLSLPQATVWRKMVELGVNTPRTVKPKIEKQNNKFFDWEDYKADLYFFT